MLIWVEDRRKKSRIIDAVISRISLGYMVGQECLFAFVLWIVSLFWFVSCGVSVLYAFFECLIVFAYVHA